MPDAKPVPMQEHPPDDMPAADNAIAWRVWLGRKVGQIEGSLSQCQVMHGQTEKDQWDEIHRIGNGEKHREGEMDAYAKLVKAVGGFFRAHWFKLVAGVAILIGGQKLLNGIEGVEKSLETVPTVEDTKRVAADVNAVKRALEAKSIVPADVLAEVKALREELAAAKHPPLPLVGTPPKQEPMVTVTPSPDRKGD